MREFLLAASRALMGCGSSSVAAIEGRAGGVGSDPVVIADFKNKEEFLTALKKCGVLEDMEILVGIDATKSNEMTGEKTFQGHCLHDVKWKAENFYSSVMTTASKFFERDLDASIPLYFFGSEQANVVGGALHVKDCKGAADLNETYRRAIATQTLSGPTTFVPLIREAIRRMKASKKYHILLLITDGEISDEESHYQVLNEASHEALSICCVGVGDGPFEAMERFDDKITKGRVFDNFQFVQFRKQVQTKEEKHEMAAEFFFRAFMEVPGQYAAIKRLLGYRPPLLRQVECDASVRICSVSAQENPDQRRNDGADFKAAARPSYAASVH